KPTATVLLSGESADEVFGGYAPFYMEAARAKGTFPWMFMGSRPKYLSPELGKLKLEEHVAAHYQEALADVPRTPGESPEQAQLRELFYLYLHYFLPWLLDRKDRVSMAAGVEIRVPFCDHRLVQYVWNVPWEMKFAGEIEKGLLRR